MAIKINGKLMGETAKEQLKLERNRADMQEKAREIAKTQKEQELLEMGKGNRKLSDYA